MKNLLKTTKLYLTLVLALLCMCVILAVSFSPSISASASGELIDHNDNNPALEMVLDVNGQTVGYNNSLTLAHLKADNSQNELYRSRIIPITVVKEIAAQKHVGDASQYSFINGFPEGTPSVGKDALTPGAIANYGIYNSDSSFVEARLVISSVQANEVIGIRVTALKSNNNARFMFYMQYDNGAGIVENKPIVIKIDVRSTFAHARKTVDSNGNGGRAWESLYVGSSSNYLTNGLAVIEVENNTFRPVSIDLATMIEGKVLYSGVKTDDAAQGQGEIRSGYDDNQIGDPWVISDAKQLRIDPRSNYTKIDGGSDLGVKLECVNTASGPLVTIQANIPQEKVNLNLYPDATDPNIFKQGVYKTLVVRFEINSTTYININFKIKFKASSAPIQKSTLGIPRTLNAMMSLDAPEYFFRSSLGTQDRESTAFRKVRVYPEDLCDYAGDQTMTFQKNIQNSVITDAVTKGYIRIEEGVENEYTAQERRYLDVIALENGTATVTFRVRYTTPTQQSELLNVTVVFNIYGKYTVAPIKVGRNKLQENVNTWALIRTLLDDKFYLVDYELASQNFVASIELKNNTFIVTPLADGQEDVILIFRDGEGVDKREVRVATTIDVNTKEGLFWATWDPFVIILCWILIGLLAILFLLIMLWLFYRAFVKSRREELETTAPASSYIIKLNSTIAAAQAQQRMTVGGGAYQTSQGIPLQLAAPSMGMQNGATSYQLGVAPPPPAGVNTYGAQPGMTVSMGATELPPNAPMPPEGHEQSLMIETHTEEIFIPLSDDEMIERIFKEKYEPRGMSWRSFSKSKDLQARELEKEKQRIREEVRNGKSIEEACGLIRAKDTQQSAPMSESYVTGDSVGTEQNPLVVMLGFDPYESVVADVASITFESKERKIVLDENGEQKMLYEEITEEESELDNAKLENQKLQLEYEMILGRLSRVEEEIEKLRISGMQASEKVSDAERDAVEYQSKITDLEVQIAMAPKKEKERLSRELVATEEKLRLAKARQEEQQKIKNDTIEAEVALAEILDAYRRSVKDKENAIEESTVKISLAQKKANSAAQRLQRAKEQQEYDRQSAYLSPILRDIYIYDRDIRRLQDDIDAHTQDKVNLKGDVSALQAQLLSTTDSATISKLSEAISQKNAQVAKLDSQISEKTKKKSNKSIEFATLRKRANDYIDKENMPIERVIECENDVIRTVVFEDYKEQVTAEKEAAEKRMEELRAEYEALAGNLDAKIAENAANVATEVQAVNDALSQTEKELEEFNAKMETATDDEKLMMSIEQAELMERYENLQTMLEETKANGIKSNLEFKMKSEEELSTTADARDKAQNDYELASAQLSKILTVSHISEIADTMFTPGTGVITRDRHEAEAANLKKQLEQTKNQVEQARIAAQMAQLEAERMMIDAERASIANKAEMERMAAEAAEKAKQARRDAEAQVAEELERKREEAELAKLETEEVRLKAAEEIEKAKLEAEEVRILAAEEAERAKAEAERTLEEAERARREVETEVESAKRMVEEDAERARRAAEEEAERARAEAERVKREAESEVERMRYETESEGKLFASLTAEEEARLTEKVAKRKLEIAELRKGILEVASEKDAVSLREKFTALELKLDEDEKKSVELKMLIEQAKNDTTNAAEMARLREQANRQPQRVVKKVTERVNRIQRPSGARPQQRTRNVTNVRNVTRVSSSRQGVAGARPAGTRPAGARPAGTRPAGARPAGTRPAGARPAGARPAGARPAGARPAGTRPAGARPAGTRPAGARPAPRPGSTPPKK